MSTSNDTVDHLKQRLAKSATSEIKDELVDRGVDPDVAQLAAEGAADRIRIDDTGDPQFLTEQGTPIASSNPAGKLADDLIENMPGKFVDGRTGAQARGDSSEESKPSSPQTRAEFFEEVDDLDAYAERKGMSVADLHEHIQSLPTDTE